MKLLIRAVIRLPLTRLPAPEKIDTVDRVIADCRQRRLVNALHHNALYCTIEPAKGRNISAID